MPKKLLLVTYYWPPKGGVGVLRWLKMSKYLKKLGWQITVLTPTPNTSIAKDNSLLAEVKDIEVVEHPIWEPYSVFNILQGKKANSIVKPINSSHKKEGLVSTLGKYIRGNFFIPDARKFWIAPAARRIKLLLANNSFDAVVSTGPPHSMHLAVLNGNKNKTPWVADFRDPWTEIDFVDDLKMGKRAKRKNARLEKLVLETAERVVTVSPHWKDRLQVVNPKAKIEVIYNGLDHEDFKSLSIPLPNKAFTIAHIGTLNNKRNPSILWDALQKLDFSYQVELIGAVDSSIFNDLNRRKIINVNHTPQLPYRDALLAGKKADMLFLYLQDFRTNMGRIPVKLFEYLALEKPILFIGPSESDAARIVTEVTNLPVFDYGDIEEISSFLKQVHLNHFVLETYEARLAIYEREYLAKQYADLLDNLIT